MTSTKWTIEKRCILSDGTDIHYFYGIEKYFKILRVYTIARKDTTSS